MKKVLVTSALPYVNNVPHLGNIIGCVLSADVFARHSRLKGRETLFICGSDEHGTATETKAKALEISPRELCDQFYAKHKDIYEWFSISFDHFGRTSDPLHHKITQDLFKKVKENGFITEKTTVQPYSMKSEMFLADRYIQGTCPHCGFEEAKGDQCDGCGKLLTPQELIHPTNLLDGTAPEFRETTHFFLSLDALSPTLQEWVAKTQDSWTENAQKTTKAWFDRGLEPRAITRDLKWGIAVPEEGYEDKVFYVWFDAPIGYISITKQLLGDAYALWWYEPDQVELYQFMAKDNIPFHSILFPAILLASKEDVLLPTHIISTEYLQYEQQKFSKSRNIGVFGDQAKESGIPSDVYRYTLLFYRPESSDTQFSWKGLQERLNNELVANVGNFVHRTLTFLQRFFQGEVISFTLREDQQEFYTSWVTQSKKILAHLDKNEQRDALSACMKLSSMGNQYFQESQPWKTRTEDEQRAKEDLSFLVFLVKDIAIHLQPFLPVSAKAIFNQLSLEEQTYKQLGKLLQAYTISQEPSVLFTKLEDEQRELFEQKHGGTMELKETDIQLRVGKIIEVQKHPKADKLFIEKVDLGDKVIQIVSGLIGHYTEEELLGKHIVVVANLKPAKLRGELSEGMLLAAEEGDTVGLVLAPQAKPGERVRTVKQGTAKEELTFEEFMQFKFEVKDREVLLNNEKLSAKDSNLVVDKDITNGSVR